MLSSHRFGRALGLIAVGFFAGVGVGAAIGHSNPEEHIGDGSWASGIAIVQTMPKPSGLPTPGKVQEALYPKKVQEALDPKKVQEAPKKVQETLDPRHVASPPNPAIITQLGDAARPEIAQAVKKAVEDALAARPENKLVQDLIDKAKTDWEDLKRSLVSKAQKYALLGAGALFSMMVVASIVGGMVKRSAWLSIAANKSVLRV
jgi:hypothetical protein